jgi:plastocyanin
MSKKSIALAALLSVGLAGPAAADEVKVSQANKMFAPGDVTIKSGDAVDFVNDDTIAHNVYTRGTPQDFSLGTIKPGDSKSVTFEKSGTYNVKCAIHPAMKMTVNVE